MKSFGLVLLLGVALLTAPASSRADYFRIQIRPHFFLPADLTIHPNDGVNWSWLPSPFTHSTTADGGQWDSGIQGSPHIFRFVFTQEGDYPYHCMLHGAPGGLGMSGIIRVVPAEDP
jgi:plastocyanin